MEYDAKVTSWTPLYGEWATEANVAKYSGDDPNRRMGLIIGNIRARNGLVEARVRFLSRAPEREARLVFKYDVGTEQYFAAGLGGWGHAYCLHYGKGGAAYTLLTGTGNSDVLLDTRV